MPANVKTFNLWKILYPKDVSKLIHYITILSFSGIVLGTSLFLLSNRVEGMIVGRVHLILLMEGVVGKSDVIQVYTNLHQIPPNDLLQQASIYLSNLGIAANIHLKTATNLEEFERQRRIYFSRLIDEGNKTLEQWKVQIETLMPWLNFLFWISIILQTINALYATRLTYLTSRVTN